MNKGIERTSVIIGIITGIAACFVSDRVVGFTLAQSFILAVFTGICVAMGCQTIGEILIVEGRKARKRKRSYPKPQPWDKRHE